MNILDLFVVKNGNENSQPASTGVEHQTITTVSQPQPQKENQEVPIMKNEIHANTEILDKLTGFLSTIQHESPDYMELKKAANSEGMLVIPDESVRFQAAFATLKSMNPNFTKDIVLNSIDAYVKELRKQNEVAKSQIEAKRKSEVEDKKLEIAEKEKRIAELQQEIVNISTEVSSMKETVAATDAECDKNISEFEYAVNLIVSNLETDKAKIEEKLVG